MSKIIEALRRKPQPQAKAVAGASSQEREIQVESTGREWTQERLADIYFSALGKPKTAEPPVIIKVVERPRFLAHAPWIITSIAFLITAGALFSTKRVWVDIRVVDDRTVLRQSDSRWPDTPAENGSLSSSSEKGAAPESADTLPLDRFSFEGGAILQSSKDPRRLTLVSSSVAPFSRALLQFEKPMDFSRVKIVLDARGAKGGEKLFVALKDEENIQGFKKGTVPVFLDGAPADWKEVEVALLDLNDNFNLKKVSSIRFEFGSKDTTNRSGDTVYVRSVRLVPLG